MFRRAAVVLLLSLMFPALPGWAQQRPPIRPEAAPGRLYAVRGTLRLATNETGVEMVKVDLLRLTGEVVLTTFTRTNGEFELSGVANGNYLLVVDVQGYETIRENIEVYNAPRIGVALYLKKPFTVGSTEPGAVVSAREYTLPKKARQAYQKGMERLYDKKDLAGSVKHFQGAIGEFPTYYEAYHQLGVAYMDLGRVAEAEEAFRKSIEVSQGRFADPHFALGGLLSNSEKFAEAEAVVRRGLELDVGAWQGYYQLAHALLGQNRLDEAEKSIGEARMRKPDYPPIHLLSANIHIRKRDYVALLRDLDEYLKLDPNSPTGQRARKMREDVGKALASPGKAVPQQKPKP